ncbi:MAG TPA: hypothetical protein VHG29_05430 [Novosphingobium sp.]|nr:hypothetical protein [Novosphingobium sp.]
MERQGDEVHIETDEARGGSTPHIVRYVLVISLLLVIAAFAIASLVGSSNNPPARDGGVVSGQSTPVN